MSENENPWHHDELLISELLKKPGAELYTAARSFARRGHGNIRVWESGLYVYYKLPIVTGLSFCPAQIIYLGVTQNLKQRFNDHAAQWYRDIIMNDDENEYYYLELKCKLEEAYEMERHFAGLKRNDGLFPSWISLGELPSLVPNKGGHNYESRTIRFQSMPKEAK